MEFWEILTKQECISVLCVLFTLCRIGGFPDRDPWTETPSDSDPSLDRHPPWTETRLNRDPVLDRDPQTDPLDRDPPGRKCHHTETPHPYGHTDTCKNITLPQSSFVGGNKGEPLT